MQVLEFVCERPADGREETDDGARRSLVRAAFEARPGGGRIVVFDSYAPWKDHLYDVEKDAQLAPENLVLYVVYPDETGGSWRVQAVTKEGEAFANRKSLPEP